MSTTLDAFTRGVLLRPPRPGSGSSIHSFSATQRPCSRSPRHPTKFPTSPQPGGLVFRPLVLPLVNHVIDRLLRDNHGLDARRRPAVDGSMQDRLPNLQLRHAVVDGAARVQAQLQPGLLADDQTQSCRMAVSESRCLAFSHVTCRAGRALTQEAALLAVEPGALPDGAPCPFGNELLARLGEGRGIVERVFHVLAAEDGLADLDALVKEPAVQLVIRCIRRHGGPLESSGKCGYLLGLRESPRSRAEPGKVRLSCSCPNSLRGRECRICPECWRQKRLFNLHPGNQEKRFARLEPPRSSFSSPPPPLPQMHALWPSRNRAWQLVYLAA